MFGKKKPVPLHDFDFSDEVLGKALGDLKWKNYDGNSEICVEVPRIILGILKQTYDFEHDSYKYTVDQYGGVRRFSPRIKPPVVDPLDKVAYYVDGVAITLREIYKKFNIKENLKS